MQKIILTTEDELRAIIREELKHLTPTIQKPADDEQPVNQEEICRFLNITTPTIIGWRKKKVIPFIQIGSRVLYQKSKVISALEKNNKGLKYR